MTKQEAIEAMKKGEKLTHSSFTPDEWISSDERGGAYTFEDGVHCPHFEFWQYRQGAFWETGWEIWTNPFV